MGYISFFYGGRVSRGVIGSLRTSSKYDLFQVVPREMAPSWYRGLCCFGAPSDIDWSGALVGCLVRTFLLHHEVLAGLHFVISTHQIRPTQRYVMIDDEWFRFGVMGKTLWERFHVVLNDAHRRVFELQLSLLRKRNG